MIRCWFLIGLIYINSCDSNNTEWFRTSETFTLSPSGEVRVIDNKGNSLYVRITDIDESRCPGDVVCITAGNVLVHVEIKDSRHSQFRTILCLGACSTSRTDKGTFMLYGLEYYIQLLEVNPYPTTKNQNEVRKAVLKLYES